MFAEFGNVYGWHEYISPTLRAFCRKQQNSNMQVAPANRNRQHCCCIVSLLLLLVSTLIPCVSCGKGPAPPVLTDTSLCVNVDSALAGSRITDSTYTDTKCYSECVNPNIIKLHQPHTITSSSNNAVQCVVRYVFLDGSGLGTQTTYERVADGNDAARINTEHMWHRHVAALTETQRLAIVSCSIENEADIPLLSMPNSTDFGFIMEPSRAFGSVHVVECNNHGGAFCMVRIDMESCINSKYVQGALPGTNVNIHNWMSLIMSMMGSAAVLMQTTEIRTIPTPAAGPGTRVISGLNTTAGYFAFGCTCTNKDNLPCNLIEANTNAMKLASGLVFTSNTVDDVLVYTGTTKTGSADDNHFDINFIWYEFDHQHSYEILQYVNGNRECPMISQKTGSTDTYHDSNGVFTIKCVMCGINAYYSEVTSPAPIMASSKTMFVSSTTQTGWTDETVSPRVAQHRLLYFVASAETPSEIFRKQYRQESVVEIGTVLTLKIGTDANRLDTRAGTPNVILTLECEGQTIDYTRDTATSSVTFEVLPAFSGKVIHVYMPALQIDTARWEVMSALIFPRAPSVQQECVACAPGKFSGLSAQKNASACIDIPVPATSYTSQLTTPRSNMRPVQRRNIPGDSLPFRMYIEVNTVILKVIEMSTIPPQQHKRTEDFAFEIWLDTTNITFVVANAPLIAKSIFQIYDPRRNDMNATTWEARPLLAGQGSILLTIHGQYIGNSVLQDLTDFFVAVRMGHSIFQLTWAVWLAIVLILVASVAGCVVCCVMSSQCHCCGKHSPADQYQHNQTSSNLSVQPHYAYQQTQQTEV